MHNAIWSAAVGSIFEMKRLDVIANNLANANTVGFRGDRIDFSSYLAQIRQKPFVRQGEELDRITQLMRTRTSFQPGFIQSTGNPLDVAITGDGLFVVETPEGPLYTRAGNFRLDSNGVLTTQDGHVVQGTAGPIQLRQGVPFEMDEQGGVYQEESEVGRLRIVQVANPETLEKVEGKRFRSTTGTRISNHMQPQVASRSLEGSNVNIVREMTYMVQAGRAFQGYQQIISLVNQINQQANNKIPQMSA